MHRTWSYVRPGTARSPALASRRPALRCASPMRQRDSPTGQPTREEDLHRIVRSPSRASSRCNGRRRTACRRRHCRAGAPQRAACGVRARPVRRCGARVPASRRVRLGPRSWCVEASHNQTMDLIKSLNYSTFLHPLQNMEVAVARCLRNLSSGKDMWPDAAAPPTRPWLHALPCLHSSLSSCGGGRAERKREQRMRWEEGLNEQLFTWPSKKCLCLNL
jgi:hypothetical protein